MRSRVAGDVADGGVHLAERQAHSQGLAAARPAGGRVRRSPRAAVGFAGRLAVRRPSRRRRRERRRASRGRAGGALADLRSVGGAGEQADRALEVERDRVEVGERVVVAEQPEAEVAVVAHHRDPERLAAGERHDRVERAQAAPEQVERELRARDVRDDEVEVALAGLQARGLAEDRRAARSPRGW